MVPLGRVHDLALEVLQALDVGKGRHMQRARGQHPVMGHDGFATRGLDDPAARAFIEDGADHFLLEVDVAAQVVLLDRVQDVVLDLAPGRITLGPVGLGRERVGVHVRLHVAGRAGVLVVAPGAAHLLGLFQDHEVLNACFLELDGHAQAAKACACDGHFDVANGWGLGLSVHGVPLGGWLTGVSPMPACCGSRPAAAMFETAQKLIVSATIGV